MKKWLLVILLAGLVTILWHPPLFAAGGPYDPLHQPEPTSPYAMDLMGPGWQWTFPRENVWPPEQAELRIDLMDSMFRQSWAAGVRGARIAVLWCLTEPQRDDYRWHELDVAFQLASNYGMTVVPQIFYTPDWAATGQDIDASCFDHINYPRNLPPQDWNDWTDFLTQLVRRYGARGKDQAHDWEIWNEPDLLEFWYIPEDPWHANVPEYARLVQFSRTVIDREDIGGKMLVGSLSDIYGAKFLEKLMALRGEYDIRDMIDVLTVHIFDEPARKIAAFNGARGDYNGPMWVTEANTRAWSESVTPAMLNEFFSILFDRKVSRVFWFLSWTSRWGPGIFTQVEHLWERESFDPSLFYPTFQQQALIARPPGRPIIHAPLDHAVVSQPITFEWERPAQGDHPIAGYKLQVDDSLYRGKPYFHAPEVDAWVPAGLVHFLPLQMTGTHSAQEIPTQVGPPPSVPVVSYQVQDLPPGVYYWRVAAVDVEGNVGTYSEPQMMFVTAGQERVFLPALTLP